MVCVKINALFTTKLFKINAYKCIQINKRMEACDQNCHELTDVGGDDRLFGLYLKCKMIKILKNEIEIVNK